MWLMQVSNSMFGGGGDMYEDQKITTMTRYFLCTPPPSMLYVIAQVIRCKVDENFTDCFFK